MWSVWLAFWFGSRDRMEGLIETKRMWICSSSECGDKRCSWLGEERLKSASPRHHRQQAGFRKATRQAGRQAGRLLALFLTTPSGLGYGRCWHFNVLERVG